MRNLIEPGVGGQGSGIGKTRRRGDKETRRRGDKETRRQGSNFILHPSSFILLLALLLTACGGTPMLSQQTANYTVQLQLDSLKVGDRTATLNLRDQAGQPVEAEQVTLVPTMLAMGMASPQVTATANGAGRYTGEKLFISMTGDWELDVNIQHSGKNETARFIVTIPTE